MSVFSYETIEQHNPLYNYWVDTSGYIRAGDVKSFLDTEINQAEAGQKTKRFVGEQLPISKGMKQFNLPVSDQMKKSSPMHLSGGGGFFKVKATKGGSTGAGKCKGVSSKWL
jgi:hypothetical protein